MNYIMTFILTFLVVYLLYLLTVILNKKQLKKFEKSNQASYFIKKYKLKINEKNVKKLANLIALANAFIISITIVVIELVSNYILKVLVAFLVIVPLILILYHIVAKLMLRGDNK